VRTGPANINVENGIDAFSRGISREDPSPVQGHAGNIREHTMQRLASGR